MGGTPTLYDRAHTEAIALFLLLAMPHDAN
jgi:hypothetical protein